VVTQVPLVIENLITIHARLRKPTNVLHEIEIFVYKMSMLMPQL
jgi:hypothetical protein